MALTKQAKILSDAQIRALLNHVKSARYPLRDTALVLLSVREGLRACELAGITWSMVLESDGALAHEIRLTNLASKGKRGGRVIPMRADVRQALTELRVERGDLARPDWPIIHSERAKGMSAAAIVVWFHRTYHALGFQGASSHSGRRTFGTRGARKCIEAGGTLRDVQQLMGHASLTTTQAYIDGSEDAKRKLVALL